MILRGSVQLISISLQYFEFFVHATEVVRNDITTSHTRHAHLAAKSLIVNLYFPRIIIRLSARMLARLVL